MLRRRFQFSSGVGQCSTTFEAHVGRPLLGAMWQICSDVHHALPCAASLAQKGRPAILYLMSCSNAPTSQASVDQPITAERELSTSRLPIMSRPPFGEGGSPLKALRAQRYTLPSRVTMCLSLQGGSAFGRACWPSVPRFRPILGQAGQYRKRRPWSRGGRKLPAECHGAVLRFAPGVRACAKEFHRIGKEGTRRTPATSMPVHNPPPPADNCRTTNPSQKRLHLSNGKY